MKEKMMQVMAGLKLAVMVAGAILLLPVLLVAGAWLYCTGDREEIVQEMA